ncbi:hypothetical protein FEM48_Zijuj07G0061100 [Ziziphus jujuba var. spinosa]|uniref:GTP-eEF1A C-terminal domain-containing protein n=1 Tax=Ziziphus jujuba var. spinosa TaxID=714518 RepID=A0A978V2X2_ZIZJJ|nr:hypothetical protein FEM48_Zijuj07G0061100 [Ziziphus jujuba var. spinosa]
MGPTKPTDVEAFSECRPLGRFVACNRHQTVAVGVTKSVEKKEYESGANKIKRRLILNVDLLHPTLKGGADVGVGVIKSVEKKKFGYGVEGIKSAFIKIGKPLGGCSGSFTSSSSAPV